MTVAPHSNLLPAAQGEGVTATVRSRVDVLGLCAEVRRAAIGAGLDLKQAGELSLVVAELGTNAVLHGRGGSISVLIDLDGWAVSALDCGPGFSDAVLADAGRSDRLGSDGIREAGDGGRSFGSGLASVRRLSSSLTLQNCSGGGRAIAAKKLSKSTQGVVS